MTECATFRSFFFSCLVASTAGVEDGIRGKGEGVFVLKDVNEAKKKVEELETERTERYVLERCPKSFGKTGTEL